MVGVARFELATPAFRRRYSNQAELYSDEVRYISFGWPGGKQAFHLAYADDMQPNQKQAEAYEHPDS